MRPSTAAALIALGAAAGANARYWLGRWITAGWPDAFPTATLLINLSGSLALGLLAGWHPEDPSAQAAWGGGLWLLAGVGFLGGYTTFSTFSVELVRLLQEGRQLAALAYALLSALGGLLAAAAGFALAKLL